MVFSLLNKYIFNSQWRWCD